MKKELAKKIASGLMVLALGIGFAGCGNNVAVPSSSQTQVVTEQTKAPVNEDATLYPASYRVGSDDAVDKTKDEIDFRLNASLKAVPFLKHNGVKMVLASQLQGNMYVFQSEVSKEADADGYYHVSTNVYVDTDGSSSPMDFLVAYKDGEVSVKDESGKFYNKKANALVQELAIAALINADDSESGGIDSIKNYWLRDKSTRDKELKKDKAVKATAPAKSNSSNDSSLQYNYQCSYKLGGEVMANGTDKRLAKMLKEAHNKGVEPIISHTGKNMVYAGVVGDHVVYVSDQLILETDKALTYKMSCSVWFYYYNSGTWEHYQDYSDEKVKLTKDGGAKSMYGNIFEAVLMEADLSMRDNVEYVEI